MNNSNHAACYYKLKLVCRDQMEFQSFCLNDRIPQEHKARSVWDFVEAMDTTICLKYINSIYGEIGRSATDPKILLALWIYTILDGNYSARKLAELCQNHDAYKWICGGIKVNRTMLAQFRSHNHRKFDELLTNCLAVMVKADLIKDTDFSQDGTRIKANAGFNSFRREDTLEKIKADLTLYIEQLRSEEQLTTNAYEIRQKEIKQRAAIERKCRVEEALKNLEAARCEKIINGKRNNDIPTEDELDEVRASITDPEVRKMKMGDGGFRLAYNVQFATGLDSRVIYGVNVVNTLDPGTAPNLMAQVYERLKNLNLKPIKKWIADAAYSAKNDIENVAQLFPNCLYYAPPKPRTGIDPKKEKKGDSKAVKKWRNMIGTEEVEELYKKRCSTAEFSNMQVKNQSLQKLPVRGLNKVKGVAFLHAIAQNCSRYFDLLNKKMKGIII
jgi:transposase